MERENTKSVGVLFVLANVAGGFLNYLFQVKASVDLPARQFSTFTAWLADLSLLFVIGTLLQYLSNFLPVRGSVLRAWLVLLNLLLLGLIAEWFLFPGQSSFVQAGLVVVAAAIFGWSLGQIQYHLLFGLMIATTLVAAAAKLGFAFAPFFQPLLENYKFAVLAGFLPGLWLLTAGVWTKKMDVTAHQNLFSPSLWAAPFILAVAGTCLPQMDLVLMSRLQTPAVFDEFARASLFYKGIYYPLFFVSQWLLPQQLRDGSTLNFKFSSLFKFLILALATSAAVMLVAQPFATLLLKWHEAPPMRMIFLSCLNICFLTLIFLMIQSACTGKQLKPAFGALIALTLEAAAQGLLKSHVSAYYAFAIPIQVAVIAGLALSSQKPRAS